MNYFRFLLLVTLFSACHQQSPTTSSLRGSLDAANAITSTASRDDALAKLAADAAEAKDLEVTKQALGGITSTDTKDKAAEAAALALAKQGETKSATEVAQVITVTSVRDRALSAVAKGR